MFLRVPDSRNTRSSGCQIDGSPSEFLRRHISVCGWLKEAAVSPSFGIESICLSCGVPHPVRAGKRSPTCISWKLEILDPSKTARWRQGEKPPFPSLPFVIHRGPLLASCKLPVQENFPYPRRVVDPDSPASFGRGLPSHAFHSPFPFVLSRS